MHSSTLSKQEIPPPPFNPSMMIEQSTTTEINHSPIRVSPEPVQLDLITDDINPSNNSSPTRSHPVFNLIYGQRGKTKLQNREHDHYLVPDQQIHGQSLHSPNLNVSRKAQRGKVKRNNHRHYHFNPGQQIRAQSPDSSNTQNTSSTRMSGTVYYNNGNIYVGDDNDLISFRYDLIENCEYYINSAFDIIIENENNLTHHQRITRKQIRWANKLIKTLKAKAREKEKRLKAEMKELKANYKNMRLAQSIINKLIEEQEYAEHARFVSTSNSDEFILNLPSLPRSPNIERDQSLDIEPTYNTNTEIETGSNQYSGFQESNIENEYKESDLLDEEHPDLIFCGDYDEDEEEESKDEEKAGIYYDENNDIDEFMEPLPSEYINSIYNAAYKRGMFEGIQSMTANSNQNCDDSNLLMVDEVDMMEGMVMDIRKLNRSPRSKAYHDHDMDESNYMESNIIEPVSDDAKFIPIQPIPSSMNHDITYQDLLDANIDDSDYEREEQTIDNNSKNRENPQNPDLEQDDSDQDLSFAGQLARRLTDHSSGTTLSPLSRSESGEGSMVMDEENEYDILNLHSQFADILESVESSDGEEEDDEDDETDENDENDEYEHKGDPQKYCFNFNEMRVDELEMINDNDIWYDDYWNIRAENDDAASENEDENENDDDSKIVEVVINQLPVRKLTAIDECLLNQRRCSICMEQYEIKNKIMTLPCFHQFHKLCANKWFKNSSKCPVCRHSICKME